MVIIIQCLRIDHNSKIKKIYTKSLPPPTSIWPEGQKKFIKYLTINCKVMYLT